MKRVSRGEERGREGESVRQWADRKGSGEGRGKEGLGETYGVDPIDRAVTCSWTNEAASLEGLIKRPR